MTTSSASISDRTIQRKIAIFYHVYQYGNWSNLVREQLDLLFSSGLYDACSFIHIGINGASEFPFSDPKYQIRYNPEPWTEETPTLVSLSEFCQPNNNWAVLYLHTKGVTQPIPETADWRRAMEYFCVERWKDCLEQLGSHDTTGCLFMDECYYGFYPHYSGNFWWSRSEYVKTLDNSYLLTGIRQNREFWIGTGNGSMHSFLNTGLNHYAVRFPREAYAHDS